MAVGAQLRIGNGSEISPLRKLMAAAVVFLAADFFLLINFMASEVNRVSPRGREGRGFYFVPIALAAYYACTWVLVARRRPEREPIVVQYQPPEGVSPAEARYIYTLTCDGRTYAAIVADLAARGLLTIEPTRDGIYVRSAIELPDAGRNVVSAVPTDLPEEERCVFYDLFQAGPMACLHPPRQSLLNYVCAALQRRTSTMYYNFRPHLLTAGLVVMSIITVWMAGAEGLLTTMQGQADLKLAAFLGSCVFAAGAASFFLWQHNRHAVMLAWRGIYRYRTLPLLLGGLFFTPVLFWLSMRVIAPVFAEVTALMLLVNTFAPPFLMGYSERGAQLMRHILGFRQFLESTQQDRLDRLDPARRDAKSELSLLPYAVALDIRERWGDRLGAETMVEVALDRML